MASTAAERKAIEVKRKRDAGLKRRSFWLDETSIAKIELHKQSNGFSTLDEALRDLIINLKGEVH